MYNNYRSYTESGVGWLREIPKCWTIKRLKYLCDVQTGNKDTVHAIENGQYPFFVRSQTVERINSFSFDCEAVLTAGDGAGVGKVFHYHVGPFDFHQRVYMLNNFRNILGKFIFYYLKENFFKVALEGAAKSTVDSLRMPLFLDFQVAVPPLHEQDIIVNFLDAETTKIDALICKQQKLIELLQEKRQAMITHAVTKGLNPDAPMKDSGIEWLGEVPEHWNLKRGRFLFEKIEDTPQEDDKVVTAYRDGQVTLRENRRVDGYTIAIKEHGYQRVYPGNLVVHGMDAFAGAIGVSDSTGKCTPEYAILQTRDPENLTNYFSYCLRIMAQRDFIYVICPSVRERAPRFRFEKLKNVFLPVPPSTEQYEIIDYISNETCKIDKLLKKSGQAISLLNERRTALVSAAVTGKIDVREA